MNKKRELYLDIVKGMAIILVMIGHSTMANEYAPFGHRSLIQHFIFSFHMPLFFIISGYFISATKPIFPYILLRNAKLILALLFYSLIKIVFYYPHDATSASNSRFFMFILS